MKVTQSRTFLRTAKKLPPKEKRALDRAIKKIQDNPGIGQLKKGDLAGVRVYKFKCAEKQYLLGYRVDSKRLVLTLLALGFHENFYRNLKR